ncbi:MAG: RluA family pseudouridine synthase [Thermoguttaceae bacterium]|nr:RluA family pseudouridine synthase [Thermoguttaceae bacterium]
MPDPSEPIFRVLPRQVDQTLAAALREWMPGASWNAVRKLLKARRVMLSGNVCVDPARRLKLHDVVKVLAHPAAPPPREEDVRIRYLDEHVVVVEKPAGMTTTRHKEERDWPARRKQLQPTLDELLPAIIARKEGRHRRKRQGIPPPVRPVHRLDRETSGLLVFARSVKAERNLGEQFRRHTTHRRYLAVALGHVKAQTIQTRLVRDRGDGRRGSTDEPGVGKPAVTHVRPLEDLGDYTLVECRLETGRTHQIRIHLAEQGHPLCGEKVYNHPRRGKPPEDHSGAPRIALHAAELGFQHPVTGEPMRFEMALPDDLAAFVNRLRRAAHRNKGKA